VKKPFLSLKDPPPLTVVPIERHGYRSPNPGREAAILHLVEAQSVGPTHGAGHGDAAVDASLPSPTIRPIRSSVSHGLLTYLGHSESCAALRRKGLVAFCDCQMKGFDDPAVTIGLVVHFARMSLAHKSSIPPVLIELLACRVEEGDAACIMVAEWLDAIGLAEVKPLHAGKRRAR
jgi:hypothetical protein